MSVEETPRPAAKADGGADGRSPSSSPGAATAAARSPSASVSGAQDTPAGRRPSVINAQGLHPGLLHLEEQEFRKQRRVCQREASLPGAKPLRVLEDSSSRQRYIERCEALRIPASSQVLKMLNTSSLSVQQYGLTAVDAEAIADALQVYDCPVMAVLLQGNSVGARGAAALCAAIERNVSAYGNAGVRELDLRDNDLAGEEAAGAVAALLESPSCRLEVLKLGGNRFGTAGFRRIMQALAPYERCVELDVGACKLSDRDGRSIGLMLQRNRSVRCLNLGWNCINQTGMKYLVKGMIIGDAVRELCLEFNCIGNGGCQHIARLARCRNLRYLDVSYNSISTAGFKAIARAFAQNRSLRRLYVDGNLIGNEGAKSLLRLMAANDALECSAGGAGISRAFVAEIGERRRRSGGEAGGHPAEAAAS